MSALEPYLLHFALACLGLAIHTLKTLRQYRRDHEKVGVLEYINGNSLMLTTGLLSIVAGMFLLHEAGQLNFGAALGLGYMADSFAESKLGKTVKVYAG